MNDEKNVVKVKSEDEQKLVVETPEGREQTYYLNSGRMMHLHAEKLQVSSEARVFDFGAHGPGMQSAISLYVQGKATLEGGTISVIGEPGNKARTLSIGFNAFDEDVRKQRQEWARKHGTMPPYTHATVGFIRHNREIGNDDDWFVECELAPETLRAISSAVSSGKLSAMSVGLTLQGVYSDGSSPSAKADWFLRPNRRDNTIDAPEKAHGNLARLSFDLASASLRPAPEADREPQAPGEPIPAAAALVAPSIHHPAALEMIAGNIEKLRSTVKWVGGFIAVVLLVLTFTSNHF